MSVNPTYKNGEGVVRCDALRIFEAGSLSALTRHLYPGYNSVIEKVDRYERIITDYNNASSCIEELTNNACDNIDNILIRLRAHFDHTMIEMVHHYMTHDNDNGLVILVESMVGHGADGRWDTLINGMETWTKMATR